VTPLLSDIYYGITKISILGLCVLCHKSQMKVNSLFL